MLVKLDTAVHDLVMANLKGQSQLEEARRTSEICVSAAVAQFGAEFRLREAVHEQTLEAIVARYAEKEAAWISESAGVSKAGSDVRKDKVAGPSYAVAAASRRKEAGSKDRKADRSRSRAEARNKKIMDAKKEDHRPAFVLKKCQGRTIKDARDMIWRQVVAKKVRPKCQTVTTKAGKVILKPTDKETSDVLKHLAKLCPSMLQEDSLRWLQTGAVWYGASAPVLVVLRRHARGVGASAPPHGSTSMARN